MTYRGSEFDGKVEDTWMNDKAVESESLTEIEGPTVISDDNSDEELQFFDSVQSHSCFPDESNATSGVAAASLSHSALIRTIDESCPCWIDMCDNRGKYVKVYAFCLSRQSEDPLFRTWGVGSKYLGHSLPTELNNRFSQRMSSAERNRRILGIHLYEALTRKISCDRLDFFLSMRTIHDKQFLNRAPPSFTPASAVRASFLARALSDRHWVEEWAILNGSDLVFFHPEKLKPNRRISLSAILNAGNMSSRDAAPLPSYYFMFIETFGRTVSLFFRDENERNSWVDSILGILTERKAKISQALDTANPLIEADNPAEEFLHKSTIWDCGMRRILNCRRFSFRSHDPKFTPDPLALVDSALRLAASLGPFGRDDSKLREFLDCAASLKEADVIGADLQEAERLAFFLNLYHLMIIHAFHVLGPPDSSLKWITYFNTIAYQCSDDIFSLAELEHNIIRCKMSFPSQFISRFVLPKSQFRFALSKPDHRINFALNCGSMSNPSQSVPIFKPECLNQQLNHVSSAFLQTTVSVATRNAREILIYLPRICQWFANDFGDGSASDVIKAIEPFLSEKKRKILRHNFYKAQKNDFEVSMRSIRYNNYSFECRNLTVVD